MPVINPSDLLLAMQPNRVQDSLLYTVDDTRDGTATRQGVPSAQGAALPKGKRR